MGSGIGEAGVYVLLINAVMMFALWTKPCYLQVKESWMWINYRNPVLSNVIRRPQIALRRRFDSKKKIMIMLCKWYVKTYGPVWYVKNYNYVMWDTFGKNSLFSKHISIHCTVITCHSAVIKIRMRRAFRISVPVEKLNLHEPNAFSRKQRTKTDNYFRFFWENENWKTFANKTDPNMQW